ncbi:MAG: hypothetical protein JWR42_951 [Marmoricola sp.]|nr:hypothetical protein [Marmoricola sp.]
MNEHDPMSSPRRDDQAPTGPSLPDQPLAPHQSTGAAPQSASRRTRRVVTAVGVGAVGLAAGGILAGTLASSASAEDRTGTGSYGAGGYSGEGFGGHRGDRAGSPHGTEKALTGTTKAKVLAAVKAKYPSATIQRLETDSDGVYEAHVLLSGKPTIVQVGKDFTVTGTQAMPAGPTSGDGRGPGGPGGHGDHDGDGPEGGTPTPPAA